MVAPARLPPDFPSEPKGGQEEASGAPAPSVAPSSVAFALSPRLHVYKELQRQCTNTRDVRNGWTRVSQEWSPASSALFSTVGLEGRAAAGVFTRMRPPGSPRPSRAVPPAALQSLASAARSRSGLPPLSSLPVRAPGELGPHPAPGQDCGVPEDRARLRFSPDSRRAQRSPAYTDGLGRERGRQAPGT